MNLAFHLNQGRELSSLIQSSSGLPKRPLVIIKLLSFFFCFCLIKKSIGTSIIISEQVFYLNCPLYFSLFDWKSLFHVTDFFHCFVVEMSTLTRENGTTTIKILAAEEVEGLIKDHEQVKAEEAKQAATKK